MPVQPRTIFVGDLHGCSEEFRDILRLLDHQPARDNLFLTGDSFARGPDPSGTLDLIRKSRAQSVLGNHDWKSFRCMIHRETGAYPDEKFSGSQLVSVDRMWPRRAEFRDYLSSLPIMIISLRWALVHAGVHPESGMLGTDLETALVIRTFPGPDVDGEPHWYESYEGKKLIVFGHDARGGLVRHEIDGLPNAIGLDTGCVYGGKLSAYILDEDRIVQVPSRRMYYDPIEKKHLS